MAPPQQQAEIALWHAEQHSPFQCKEITGKFTELKSQVRIPPKFHLTSFWH